jgi:hypothetical protein
MRRLAIGISLLFLVSCEAPSGSQPISENTTTFDGLYTGVANSIGNCSGSLRQTMTIEDGRARMVANPATNLIFAGRVGADGSVSMYGSNNLNSPGMMLVGRVAGDQFNGRSRGLRCDLEVSLRRSAVPTGLPIPANAEIVQPASDVRSDFAAFSGHWGGFWGGQLAMNLIVQKVESDGYVFVTYVWGGNDDPDPARKIYPGSQQYSGKIENGAIVITHRTTSFRFFFDRHGPNVLVGQRVVNNNSADYVVMHKVVDSSVRVAN